MESIIPPVIAVIGSDGSGKSTVCEHLISVVKKYGAAERVHLGKQAGNVGRAVVKMPLMGKSLNKSIERKIDIDANQPLEQVLVDAENAIKDFMAARGYH
ncbi:hypothetical protein D0720_000280 [Escherichia albertii]|nr:hypothetical protein [Escherichia albertii]EEX4920365.1 hypothetical protein [Escherichia albertii]EFJ2285769.1 hypothetical protein [Escherichia albertii]EFO0109412.1 hypothetical protein [Escherichia albertii]MLY51633.1 hypothetical protein [Escherichia albertii]